MNREQGPKLSTGQNQQFQLTQKLIMSPNMQQAIRLLQLPLPELEMYLEEQMVQNPLLEFSEENSEEKGEENQEYAETVDEEKELVLSDQDFSILSQLDEDFRDHFSATETFSPLTSEEKKLKTFQEESLISDITLQEQLTHQAHETFDKKREIEIAEMLIGYIDELGFFTTPIKEICQLHNYKEIEVLDVLKEIQTFEPFGVGAANIQESLLIQLRCHKKEHSLAYLIIQDHYDDLLHNHMPSIQKKLKRPLEEIQAAIEKDIAKLDLHPGTLFSIPSSTAIIPDVILRQENDQLIVDVDKEFSSLLRINHRYLKMLEDPNMNSETKQFIKKHLFSAKWLMKNLQQRYSTIERIAQSLARTQYEFFMHPNGQLVPLTMKSIADELNVHESTIARTVANKYIYSPKGLLPLRSFFTHKYISNVGEDLSSSTVKQAIQDIIENENKEKPFADEKISQMLKEKGITCARRTVSKYRLVLQIGNTQQRRKYR